MYSPQTDELQDASGHHKDSPEGKIKQVKSLASNAYELINTLEQMKRTRDEKAELLQKQSRNLRDAVKGMLKDMDHHRGSGTTTIDPSPAPSMIYRSASCLQTTSSKQLL